MSCVSIDVWSLIFDYLRDIGLIEASALCKEWNSLTRIKQKCFSKLKESHKIFFDRDWLIKSYQKTIDRFYDDMYWEIINIIALEKLEFLRAEPYNRLYYSIFPFRVWSRLWGCCRSQFDPSICRFCAKLLIKYKKVDKEIRRKLTFDSRKNIPSELYYGVVSNGTFSLFVHINSGPDRQGLILKIMTVFYIRKW